MSVHGIHILRTIKPKVQLLKLVSAIFENNVRFVSKSYNIRPKQIFRSSSLPDFASHGSQYYPPSPAEIAEQKISEYISQNNPRTFDEWQEAKDHLYTEISFLTDVNYSSVIMNTLLNRNNIETAQTFIKYLEENNMKPNSLAYLQYMSLCSRNVEQSGEGTILETFKKIQLLIDSTPVLDRTRAAYLIHSLCNTNKWRLAFDYIKKIPYSPNLEIKNSLASAAIRNGDETLAWQIITKWCKKDEMIGDRVIVEFLKYAVRLQKEDNRKANAFISNLFHYIDQNQIVVSKDAVSVIEKYFKCNSSKWKISYTKVSRTGECDTCRKSLKLVELTDEEFLYLKNSFLQKSVKKNDIFINTTLEEFKKYIAFIEKHKPFHVVIDGLNVAYTVQKSKNNKNLAIHLLKVVEKVSGQSRRVLVLGRKHMVNWPQNIMRKITKCAAVFLTNNISQDDPFTLYAALSSGPDTYILTMDLMRDHVSRLDDPKLILLFKKWQQSHQILMTVDENSDVKLMQPVRHNISIQGSIDSGCLHIPFEDKIIRDTYEELNNWLCIQNNT